MSRFSLLTSLFESKDNKEVRIREIIKADEKFLKRRIQEIGNELEDLEEALTSRLQSELVIDKSTVENDYQSIIIKRNLLELYKEFQKEFLTKENN